MHHQILATFVSQNLNRCILFSHAVVNATAPYILMMPLMSTPTARHSRACVLIARILITAADARR